MNGKEWWHIARPNYLPTYGVDPTPCVSQTYVNEYLGRGGKMGSSQFQLDVFDSTTNRHWEANSMGPYCLFHHSCWSAIYPDERSKGLGKSNEKAILAGFMPIPGRWPCLPLIQVTRSSLKMFCLHGEWGHVRSALIIVDRNRLIASSQ